MPTKTVAEALRIKPNTIVWVTPPSHLDRIGSLPDGVTVADSIRQAGTAIVFVDGEASARATLANLRDDLDAPKVLWVAYPQDLGRDRFEVILGEHRRRSVSRQVTIDGTWVAMRFGKMKRGEQPVDPAAVRVVEEQPSDLPGGLGSPARRALAGAGIATLADLSGWREKDVLALHGMGPKAMPVLRQALADAGLSFAGEA
ncbi:MAG TPA: hypothetical protein VD789_14360 [Thermomicrobiales bacterium]|nr:hypothetical protein [Thermomicrobiales bacterium]